MYSFIFSLFVRNPLYRVSILLLPGFLNIHVKTPALTCITIIGYQVFPVACSGETLIYLLPRTNSILSVYKVTLPPGIAGVSNVRPHTISPTGESVKTGQV